MMVSHPQPAYKLLEVPYNLLFRDPSEHKDAKMQNNERQLMLANSSKGRS
jgi:hypothetical protein